MWIVNQHKNEMFNLDNYTSIAVRQNEVLVYDDDRDCQLLGRYESDERAEEVSKGLIEFLCSSCEIPTITMPEE